MLSLPGPSAKELSQISAVLGASVARGNFGCVDAGRWTWPVPLGFCVSAIYGWSSARWQCSFGAPRGQRHHRPLHKAREAALGQGLTALSADGGTQPER